MAIPREIIDLVNYLPTPCPVPWLSAKRPLGTITSRLTSEDMMIGSLALYGPYQH